jgi:hypothetical protein
MTDGDNELPHTDVEQCADDPFRKSQSEHLGQWLWYPGTRSKTRSQSGGQD